MPSISVLAGRATNPDQIRIFTTTLHEHIDFSTQHIFVNLPGDAHLFKHELFESLLFDGFINLTGQVVTRCTFFSAVRKCAESFELHLMNKF